MSTASINEREKFSFLCTHTSFQQLTHHNCALKYSLRSIKLPNQVLCGTALFLEAYTMTEGQTVLCIYTYLQVRHRHTHVSSHICIQIPAHTHSHIYIHICTHAHTHSCSHKGIHIYTDTCAYLCTHMYVHVHSHMCTCMHAESHVCTHRGILVNNTRKEL